MPSSLVFIVDDDPVFSNILGMMLNQKGFEQLAYYTTAEQCIASIDENPDFLFLDYHLEDMDGLTILGQIKNMNEKIRVFVITSLEDPEVEKACLECGAELFINKGSLLDDFPQELEKALLGN